MRATFPAPSARIKATKREAAYPILKELALAGTPGSKAMKQVTQQLFSYSLKAAGEVVPDLANEEASVGIWCLAQNPDCYKQRAHLEYETAKRHYAPHVDCHGHVDYVKMHKWMVEFLLYQPQMVPFHNGRNTITKIFSFFIYIRDVLLLHRACRTKNYKNRGEDVDILQLMEGGPSIFKVHMVVVLVVPIRRAMEVITCLLDLMYAC